MKPLNTRSSMRRRTSKHARLVKRIKALVLTASVMATFAGTHLMAQEEVVQEPTTVSQAKSIVLLFPAGDGSAIVLPQASLGSRFQLDPIPQTVRPRLNPVARSHSSH